MRDWFDRFALHFGDEAAVTGAFAATAQALPGRLERLGARLRPWIEGEDAGHIGGSPGALEADLRALVKAREEVDGAYSAEPRAGLALLVEVASELDRLEEKVDDAFQATKAESLRRLTELLKAVHPARYFAPRVYDKAEAALEGLAAPTDVPETISRIVGVRRQCISAVRRYAQAAAAALADAGGAPDAAVAEINAQLDQGLVLSALDDCVDELAASSLGTTHRRLTEEKKSLLEVLDRCMARHVLCDEVDPGSERLAAVATDLDRLSSTLAFVSDDLAAWRVTSVESVLDLAKGELDVLWNELSHYVPAPLALVLKEAQGLRLELEQLCEEGLNPLAREQLWVWVETGDAQIAQATEALRRLSKPAHFDKLFALVNRSVKNTYTEALAVGAQLTSHDAAERCAGAVELLEELLEHPNAKEAMPAHLVAQYRSRLAASPTLGEVDALVVELAGARRLVEACARYHLVWTTFEKAMAGFDFTPLLLADAERIRESEAFTELEAIRARALEFASERAYPQALATIGRSGTPLERVADALHYFPVYRQAQTGMDQLFEHCGLHLSAQKQTELNFLIEARDEADALALGPTPDPKSACQVLEEVYQRKDRMDSLTEELDEGMTEEFFKLLLERRFEVSLAQSGGSASERVLSIRRIYEVMTEVPQRLYGQQGAVKRIRQEVGYLGISSYDRISRIVELQCGRASTASPVDLCREEELGDVLAECRPLQIEEMPNRFDWAVLHELGHATDAQARFMENRRDLGDYGAWHDYRGQIEVLVPVVHEAFPYDVGYIEELLRGTDPPAVKAPAGHDDEAWERLRDELRAWCVDGRVSVTPWKLASTNARRELNGTVYQEVEVGHWVGYPLQARERGLTGYQFKAPGEWFAELFAGYKSEILKPAHPAMAPGFWGDVLD